MNQRPFEESGFLPPIHQPKKFSRAAFRDEEDKLLILQAVQAQWDKFDGEGTGIISND